MAGQFNASDETQASVSVQPIRKQRLGGAAFLAGSLATLFVLPFLVGALAWLPVLLGIAGTIASIAFLAGLQRGPGERALSKGVAEQTSDGLLVRQGRFEQLIDPSMVKTGWCEATGEGSAVVLRLDNGTEVAIQPGDGDVDGVLRCVGLPASARAERMRLGGDDVAGRRTAAVVMWPLLAAGVPMALGSIFMLVASVVTWDVSLLAFGGMSVLSSAPILLLSWWVVAKLVPTWLSVGTDGVLIQLLRRKFIPFSDLTGVRIDGSGSPCHVLFVRKRSKPIKVKTATHAQAEAVQQQVESALDAFESRRRAALIEDLEPGDRTEAEWRESLKGVLKQDGYRSQAVDREQLLRVVEDPGQHPRVRVAAAVALEEGSQPEEKQRIRVAAQASASPRVRVALEQAAEGGVEDDTLSEVRRVTA